MPKQAATSPLGTLRTWHGLGTETLHDVGGPVLARVVHR